MVLLRFYPDYPVLSVVTVRLGPVDNTRPYLSSMVPIVLWKGTVLFIFFDFNWFCWWVVIGENIVLISEYIIVDIE